MEENTLELVQASLAIREDINRLFLPTKQSNPNAEKPVLNPDNKSDAVSQGEVAGSRLPSISQDDCKPDNAANNGSRVVIESELEKESRPDARGSDIEMGETRTDAELDENIDRSDIGVVVLDDKTQYREDSC